MKRRDVLIGAVVFPVSLGLSGQVMGARELNEETLKEALVSSWTPARHAWLEQQYDKYWEQQWLISELEEERSAVNAERGAMCKATGPAPSVVGS